MQGVRRKWYEVSSEDMLANPRLTLRLLRDGVVGRIAERDEFRYFHRRSTEFSERST